MPEVAEPSRFLYEIGALSSTADRELGPVETAMVAAGPILSAPVALQAQAPQAPIVEGPPLQALQAAPHPAAIESGREVLETPQCQVAFSGQDLAAKSVNDIAMHELEPEVDQAEFDTPGAQSCLLSGKFWSLAIVAVLEAGPKCFSLNVFASRESASDRISSS